MTPLQPEEQDRTPGQDSSEDNLKPRDSPGNKRQSPPRNEQYHRLKEYFICLTAGCNNINLPKLHTSRKVIGTEQGVL